MPSRVSVHRRCLGRAGVKRHTRRTISCWESVVLELTSSAVNNRFTDSTRCYFQMEFTQRKKSEGKKVRDDKDKVMNVLFAAFEKHQYYNLKDLAGITRQPVVSRAIRTPSWSGFLLICTFRYISLFS